MKEKQKENKNEYENVVKSADKKNEG